MPTSAWEQMHDDKLIPKASQYFSNEGPLAPTRDSSGEQSRLEESIPVRPLSSSPCGGA